jgi:hypothetical protein
MQHISQFQKNEVDERMGEQETGSDQLNQRCEFCGSETIGSNVCYRCLGNPQRQEFFEILKDLKQPVSDEQLTKILGSTVKKDDANKLITFFAMLSTYTSEDQTNIGFLADSSTGKSYIPLELANGYFPKEDLIKLGYCSPTAFFHEWGIALPDPTDQREDVEPDKRRKIIHVDLHQKILIFLDQPHSSLLQRLRPLLSHDEKQMVAKITDRREKSGLRAKTVVIEGYPTVVFCTAKINTDEQERTRLLLLSPEVSQEKLREAIALKIEKESDRASFTNKLENDTQRELLANRVRDIKAANFDYVVVPEELREQIYTEYMESRRWLQARHQRDISKLLSIVKGHALFNFQQRERIGDKTIVANIEDVQAGFRLYNKVSEANELGIPPEIFDVYKALEEQFLDPGLNTKEFQKAYYEMFHRYIGRDKAAACLKTLATTGLLVESQDTTDKRVTRYMRLGVGVTPENINENIPPPPATYSFDNEEVS